MTKVSPKCAWEYCVYIGDNDFGLYNKNGQKTSMPFGMAVNKVYGDSGRISVKVAKSLFNNSSILRYTVTSFSPDLYNSDSLWQGGSSAADVFPGTPATFGGEINGYGEVSSNGILSATEYTIFYVYDGINPIIEYSPNGSVLARYIYAGGMHIAKVAGADTSYYLSDAIGSARKMIDETGATVSWSGAYYPFGEATTSGTRTNTHQFTGKEMDSEMGLNYFCQRYYDPQIGRFMSLDPQDSQALSPYAYCANNPLKFLDPTGQKTERDEWKYIPCVSPYNYGNSGPWSENRNWFMGSFNQLDPNFWYFGCDLTPTQYILAVINLLRETEWGRKYGMKILKKLLQMFMSGQIAIEGNASSTEQNKISVSMDLIISARLQGWEILAGTLIHEGVHAMMFGHEDFQGFSEIAWTNGLLTNRFIAWQNLIEGAALIYETSFYVTFVPVGCEPLGVPFNKDNFFDPWGRAMGVCGTVGSNVWRNWTMARLVYELWY